MQLKAMVVDDVTADWEMGTNKGTSRKLTLVDQSDTHRLIPAFLCKIDVKSDLTGDGKSGASLKDAVVEIAVTDIEQQEHNKRLTFKGTVLRILGRMTMEPFDPNKGAKVAAR